MLAICLRSQEKKEDKYSIGLIRNGSVAPGLSIQTALLKYC